MKLLSNTRIRISAIMVAGVALSASLFAAPVAAQYPQKPIKLIVTWPAGGSTDVIARLLADPLGKELGQPVAVVNRAGGGGSLGTRAVLDAPKDGYTLLATTSGNHILTPLKNDVGYRYDDFVAIGQLVSASLVLAVRADAKWQSLKDFVADAKADPGKYLFGAVPSTMPHLTLNGLSKAAGLDLVHVPQKGGAPGAKALLAGDVQLLPANASSAAANLKAKKFRALAVFSDKRDSTIPNVPTAAEQGYAVYGSPFVGVAAAKGVPSAVIDKLRAALEKVAADQEFRAKASNAGATINFVPHDKFAAAWKRDWEAYEPQLKKK